MFLKPSRYYGIPTVATPGPGGGEVQAVKFRRLPAIAGTPTVIQGTDRVDILAETNYREAARYWHVADANTELEALHLARPVGRVIKVPET